MQTCKHGKGVWKNYGDGKVRHFDKNGKPMMDICDDEEMYRPCAETVSDPIMDSIDLDFAESFERAID